MLRSIRPFMWALTVHRNHAMNDIAKFESQIQKALDEIGSRYLISNIISETLECKTEIVADEIAHGGSEDVEFWNYISDGLASIVTFIEKDQFAIYVFKERIENVTPILDKFSMSEVEGLKEVLNSEFGQTVATAQLTRSLAEYWLLA
jgi:hypothetical protein